MTQTGYPGWLADAINELNDQMKQSHFTAISADVATLTGRPATALKVFINDHRAVFA